MGSCPIRNADWVTLVDEVGEFAALAMHSKNGDSTPNIYSDLNLPEESSNFTGASNSTELTAAHVVTQKPIGTPFEDQTEGVGICDGTCNIMAHRLKEAKLPFGTTHISDKYANYHAVALTDLDGKRYILNQPQHEFIGREYQKAPLWEQIEYWRNMDQRFNRHMPRMLNDIKYGMGLENSAYESFFNTANTEYGDYGPFFKDVEKVGEGHMYYDPETPGEEVDIYKATSVEDSEVKIKFKVKKGTSHLNGFIADSMESTKRDEKVPVWTSQKLKPRFIEATKENLISEYQLTEEQAIYSMENILKAEVDRKSAGVAFNKTVTDEKRLKIKDDLEAYNAKLGTNHTINFVPSTEANKFNYTVKEDFNSAEHKQNPSSTLFGESPFQLSATGTAPNAALNASMEAYLRSINVSVEEVLGIKDKNGNSLSAVAKANMTLKLVEVISGKADISTLPEESAHFAIRILKNSGSPLYKAMASEIVNYALFDKVKAEYAEVYNNDMELIIEEAIGKLVSQMIVAKHTGMEAPEKASRFKRWFDKVIALLRKIMGNPRSNPFVKVAADMLNTEISKATSISRKSSAAALSGNPMYELTSKEAPMEMEDIISLLDDTNRRMQQTPVPFESIKDKMEYGEYIQDEDGIIMLYKDIDTGKIIANRVTHKTAMMLVKKVGKDKIKSWGLDPKNLIKREGGTKLHAVMEQIAGFQHEGKGNRAQILKDSGLPELLFKKLERSIAKKLEDARKKQKEIDSTQDFVLRVEQTVHSPEGKRNITSPNITGTIDFMVIFSDKSAFLYDYKFISPTAEAKHAIGFGKNLTIISNPSGMKMEGYDSQMGIYKDILMRNYGITKVHKSRMDIIHVQYDRQKIKGKYVMTDKVAKLETGEDNKFLGDLPVGNETFGIRGVDKVITQFSARRKVLKSKQKKSDNDVKYDAFAQEIKVLDESIRSLQLGGGVDRLFADAKVKMHRLEASRGLDKSDPNYLSDADLLDAIESFGLLEGMAQNFSEYFKELKIANPTFHKSLRAVFKEMQSSLALAVGNINEEVRSRVIENASDVGVENVTRVVKGAGFFANLFNNASDSTLPTQQAAWAMVEKAQNNTRLKTEALRKEIDKMIAPLKERGNLQDSFNLLINNKTGNLIQRFSSDYYDQVKQAREDRNIKWLKDHFEVNAERMGDFAARKAAAFKRIEDLNPNIEILGPSGAVLISEDLESTRAYLRKAWLAKNDFSESSAWFSPSSSRFLTLKKEKEAQYYSEAYNKFKDDVPLNDFYNFYIETNMEMAKMTGLRINQTHIANIFETAVEGAANGNFAGIIKNALNSLRIKDTDATLGNLDPVTGERIPTIPILFLDPLTDNSNATTIEGKTRDLGVALALMGESSYKYADMAEIEEKLLLFSEFLYTHGEALVDTSGNSFLNNVGKIATSAIGATASSRFNKLFIKKLLYGQAKQNPDVNINGYSLTKTIEAATTYFAAKVLGFAGVGAMAAHMAASTAAAVEGSKGIHFTTKQYRDSALLQVKQDKTFTVLNRYFEIDVGNKSRKRANRLSVHGKAANLFTVDTLFVTYRVADEIVEHRMLSAMTMQYGVDKDGMPRRLEELPEGSKSIRELTEAVLATSKEGDTLDIGISENGYLWFRGMARTVARSVKGMNPQDDPNLMGTTIAGPVLMMFKSWMPGILQERFGDLRYRPKTRTFEHGRYRVVTSEALGISTSVLQMTKNVAIEGLKLTADALTFGLLHKMEPNMAVAAELYQTYKEDNLDSEAIQNMGLSDFVNMRRGQLKAAATELRRILMVLAAVMLLGLTISEDDDEDAFYKKYWATRKLRQALVKTATELGFAVNPKEFSSLTSGAIPLTGLFNSIIDATVNTGDELADWATGREDGRDNTGWGYYTLPFFPGVHGFSRFFEVREQDKKAAKRSSSYR